MFIYPVTYCGNSASADELSSNKQSCESQVDFIK